VKEYTLCAVSPLSLPLETIEAELKNVHSKILERTELDEHYKAIDISFRSPVEEKELSLFVSEMAINLRLEAALFASEDRHHPRRLIAFDMDSTLIQHEVIDEMALVHGIGAKVKKITEKAMNGELNFDEALRERIALLKGFERKHMDEIMARLKLTPGVEKLISTLHAHGFKSAILSGGFKFFADQFKERLGMEYAFANELEWSGTTLSGTIGGKIINAQEKARLLQHLAIKNDLNLKQVVAVGDGANDLLMLGKAGLGIAYHAKDKVRQEAKYQVNFLSMETILYFLGIKGNHFNETLQKS
jgi:phosphoserine phosphatase